MNEKLIKERGKIKKKQSNIYYMANKHKSPIPLGQRFKLRISGGRWGSNVARKRYLLKKYQQVYARYTKSGVGHARLQDIGTALRTLGVPDTALRKAIGMSSSGFGGGAAPSSKKKKDVPKTGQNPPAKPNSKP